MNYWQLLHILSFTSMISDSKPHFVKGDFPVCHPIYRWFPTSWCYEPTLQTPAISIMDMDGHTYTSADTHISWVSSRLSPLPRGCAVYVLNVFPGDTPHAFGGLHQVFALTREFWKAHILSLRSFADICAPLQVFALVAAGWFSAFATMELRSSYAILWNSQSGRTIAWFFSILNTCMHD